MMAHDASGPVVTSMIEAASRQSRIGLASLFKSGTWFYVEEFEDALASVDSRWQAVIVGAGTITVTTPAFRGAQAARFATDAVTNDSCAFTQTFPAYLTNWGMEAMFDLRSGVVGQENWTATIELDFNPGNTYERQMAKVTIQNVSGTVTVSITEWNGSANVVTAVKTWAPLLGNTIETWHWIKLTMEPNRAVGTTIMGTYGLLYLDDLCFDLRGHKLGDLGVQATDGAYIQPTIKLVTNAASAKIMGVDDLIITRDEPI